MDNCPGKFADWSGQIVISRTANGFLVYPKIGQSILTELMRVAEGVESYKKLTKIIEECYQHMESLTRPIDSAVVNPNPIIVEKSEKTDLGVNHEQQGNSVTGSES